MEQSNDFTPINISKIDTCDTSSNELEVNEVSKGMKWSNNNYRKNSYGNNRNFGNKANTTTKNQENKKGNKQDQKERDAMITLMHESSHFVSEKFGKLFFKQFDLTMQLRKQELRKQGKVVAEVSEVTEEDIINAFGVTKDHMREAAILLESEGKTEKSVHPSA